MDEWYPDEPFFGNPSIPEVTGNRLRDTGLLGPDGSRIFKRNPLGFTDQGAYVIYKETTNELSD